MKNFLLILSAALLLHAPRVSADLFTNAVIIEALIDGPSELRVKNGAIYWINGDNAKPGLHAGAHEATYINGQAWHPVWRNKQSRGADKSSSHEVNLDPKRVEFELLAVGGTRGATGIEKRDPIQVNPAGDELSIVIPDSQSGARWYKFALKPKAK